MLQHNTPRSRGSTKAPPGKQQITSTKRFRECSSLRPPAKPSPASPERNPGYAVSPRTLGFGMQRLRGKSQMRRHRFGDNSFYPTHCVRCSVPCRWNQMGLPDGQRSRWRKSISVSTRPLHLDETSRPGECGLTRSPDKTSLCQSTEPAAPAAHRSRPCDDRNSSR